MFLKSQRNRSVCSLRGRYWLSILPCLRGVCVRVYVEVTESCWNGEGLGPKCQVGQRSRERTLGLCSCEMWFSPLLLQWQQARDCRKYAAQKPKGLLARKAAAAGQGERSCEIYPPLAVGLVVAEGQASCTKQRSSGHDSWVDHFWQLFPGAQSTGMTR